LQELRPGNLKSVRLHDHEIYKYAAFIECKILQLYVNQLVVGMGLCAKIKSDFMLLTSIYLKIP